MHSNIQCWYKSYMVVLLEKDMVEVQKKHMQPTIAVY